MCKTKTALDLKDMLIEQDVNEDAALLTNLACYLSGLFAKVAIYIIACSNMDVLQCISLTIL